ncbi:MAG: TonB-dependent receptor plug domain-containing protein [Ignavibacteria bacterium]
MKNIFNTYFLIVFLLVTEVLAQENGLHKDSTVCITPSIQVIGSRLKTDAVLYPGRVTVLNTQDIQNVNGNSLAEVLQTAPDIFIKSYGSTSALGTMSINGLGPEHTVIVLDGVKLNSNQNSQVDLSLFAKDFFDRIEVLPDGASSEFGSNGVGGIINIVSKRGVQEQEKLSIKLTYGSLDKKGGSVYYSTKLFQELNLYGGFSYEKSSEDYDYYLKTGLEKIRQTMNNLGYRYSNFISGISYSITPTLLVEWNSNILFFDRNLPGFATLSPTFKSNQKDYKVLSSLKLTNTLGYLQLINSLNYSNSLLKYIADGNINDFYRELGYNYSGQINFASKMITLYTGVDISHSRLLASNFEIEPVRTSIGIFSGARLIPAKILKVYPSVRYDYFSDIKKNAVTSKLSVNIKPFEREFYIKGSVSNNFRAPSFNDLFWKGAGNINLRPERSVNFTISTNYSFDLISSNFVDFSYTYINFFDKILWRPYTQSLWRPENIASSESKILSLSLGAKKQFNDNLFASVIYSYTYNRVIKTSKDFAEDPSYFKQLIYIPKELSKVNFHLNFRKLTLNLHYLFTGIRYSDVSNQNPLSAFDLLNGNLSYAFVFGGVELVLRAEVTNILDTDYELVSGYPMPLRYYNFSLKLNLK